MTRQEKLNEAERLMREVSADWIDESMTEHYPRGLASFDEVVEDIACIKLKN